MSLHHPSEFTIQAQAQTTSPQNTPKRLFSFH